MADNKVMWRVGVDVGGTFTDLFAWNQKTNQSISTKVLTTKEDRALGVIQAIKQADIDFSQISHLLHGTTTATNALIERDYPEAAFVTTEGFRDTIEIGRQHRQYLYDPYQSKPSPIIRRRDRFAVPERMSATGNIRRPLDEAAAHKISERIAERGYAAIGVGFINSYANPEHEIRMREIVLANNPNAHVVISAETRPVFREHARFTTTAIRAALMPVMTGYFERLEQALKAEGFSHALLILKSNGGVMGAELAKQRPEELIESGPAGGVAYAAYLSQATHIENIIHTDVGGTSFDASIVEAGHGLITRDYELEWEVPVSVPMLDIRSVGAGGGSIAWVDTGNSLRVGPKSAGADPGPACYRRGGTEPTVTDANLILGRLHPSLGGKFELDPRAAEQAIDGVAHAIGLSRLETAEGIIRISCEAMAQAVKGVVVDRARDPRDYVLTSFGGAGPMHACFVAQAMNVPKVLVPAHAGVASAFGATAMNLRHDLESFLYAELVDIDIEQLNTSYEELEARGRVLLASDGVAEDGMVISRTAQMRYLGQTFEVECEIPSGRIDKHHVPEIAKIFHAAHTRDYGVHSEDFPIVFVALGVTAIGKFSDPPIIHPVAKGRGASPSTRPVYFGGQWIETPVFAANGLTAGLNIPGPSIVEYADACAVLPPGCKATTDEMGNLLIEIGNA
ncbi:MAG: hydantoinase/oxoprolinase family protein [Proteobacteria bacterium]|nr:hydantoinase/oxoprolinase family protein [Pseudomonadota bacterium]MDA1355968.1 hydantoinase/oxoprolinase family protein [Pseudomonadota bacterium]